MLILLYLDNRNFKRICQQYLKGEKEMINRDRLINTFIRLAEIESPSKKEESVAIFCKEWLQELGISVIFDNAKENLNGNSSNLIAKVKGDIGVPALLLCAHLDTVKPEGKVKPIIEGDLIRSDGTTILGADCKAGVSIILEAIKVIKEDNIPHKDLEIVFTVCEEIGLVGAKELNYNLITAKEGLILDGGSIYEITNKAPSANSLSIVVHGKEAHAGVAPEKGINAIALASKAISRINLGRIDEETTANIGLISGGIATNIVPNKVEIKGEARSHNEAKLQRVTEEICQSFKSLEKEAVVWLEGEEIRPRVDLEVKRDYDSMHIKKDHPLIHKVMKAGENLGLKLHVVKSGGGSDANIFNAHDIDSIIIGNGAGKPHTKDEFLKVDELIKGAELLLEIIKAL